MLSQNINCQIGKITKDDAMQGLRVLTDIAKNDAARHKSSIYEPFLTKMVEDDVVNPIVTLAKTSRLLA